MPNDNYQPRDIQDIASSDNDILANLYKHSLAILNIQSSVRLALGQPLSQHLHIANITADSITIFTDSQAWATKLRFETQEIINIARKLSGFNNLESVRIRVSPELVKTARPGKSISMSPSTSRLLRKVAENINDTALQTALLKLSRNC